MTPLSRALVRDVWAHLRARETRPRPVLPEGRGGTKVVMLDGGQGAEIWIYDEIGFWGITAIDVVTQLLAIGTPRLTVRLNSPGGDVFDSIAIYNALMEHPAAIDVQVDGLAASGASLIAMAGETRAMKTGTQMMIHDAHGMVMGNEADMLSFGALLGQVSGELAAVYAARAGGTADEWRAAMRAETWYTAAEAVTAGLATAGPAAAGQDDAPHLVPAARFDLNLTSFLYAGRAAAPSPSPPGRLAAVSPAAAPTAPARAAETGPGWSDPDLDLTQFAAAFAAARTDRSKEAAR
jgi:ATP-dependent protease ClpP protease subunit